METRALRYGDISIPFDVVRSPRRHKTISVQVHPDCRVQVSAPALATDATIDAVVNRRAGWIWRSVQQAKQHLGNQATRRFVSGESHLYLGRRHVLKVHLAKNMEPHLGMFRGRLEVTVRARDPGLVKEQLMKWYRIRAAEVFQRRLDALLPSLIWKQSEPPILRLRSMKKRWGSCSSRGVITLNPNLVMAPRDCVDYVICHELCHLKVFNHSPRFYRLMDQMQPDWQETKVKLDGMAAQILHT